MGQAPAGPRGYDLRRTVRIGVEKRHSIVRISPSVMPTLCQRARLGYNLLSIIGKLRAWSTHNLVRI
jgi:hypothetical protein